MKNGGGAIGTGATLTYSFFNPSSSIYNYNLASNGVGSVGVLSSTVKQTFTALNDVQKTAALAAMDRYANITKITFNEVQDSANIAGDIRWQNSNLIETAASIGPSKEAYAGDIWIGGSNNAYYDQAYKNPVVNAQNVGANTWGFTTFLHELGHALGLQHPHHTAIAVDPEYDQLKYSVMSYKHFAGAQDGHYAGSLTPTSLMLNDILTIQNLYGVNTSYKTGNDTYSWTAGRSVFETIYDAGGIDTINASNQTQSVKINLQSGQWSEIGQSFNRGDGNFVRDCLTIAYGCTIENATGSSFNDVLIGNDANNVLIGGAGNDVLDGAQGVNSLRGGAGNDTYLLNKSLATEFQSQRWETKAGGFSSDQKWRTGDFNGDGKADLVNIFNDGGLMSTDVHMNNGTGSQMQRWETKVGGFWDTQKWATGDFNGDRKDDLVNIFNDNGLMSADVHLSNGTGFQSLRWETKAGGFSDTQKWTTGDFNGDGKTDLINIFNDNGLMSADVHISDGTGFQIQRWQTKVGGFSDNQKWLSADVNGDGKADLINIFNDNGLASVDIHISTGTGFNARRWETKAGGFWDAQQWSAADVNGDGKADLINAFNDDGLMSADVHINTGSTFQAKRWETKTGGFWDGQKWMAADITGDGRADLINVFDDLGSASTDVHVASNPKSKSDIILENAAEGTDTVKSNTSHTLEANVENLTLTGNAAALIARGNILSNTLVGNSMDNSLYGLAGNDTLQGNQGNDALQGDIGNDTYRIARGDGIDQITDNDSTSGNNDLLWFTQGVSYDQLWFEKVNNHLEVSVIGATDKVTINNWYANPANHIETIKTSDNKTLSDSKIDNLVSAMAAFTVPAMGQTTLSSTYANSLAPVLAASWV